MRLPSIDVNDTNATVSIDVNDTNATVSIDVNDTNATVEQSAQNDPDDLGEVTVVPVEPRPKKSKKEELHDYLASKDVNEESILPVSFTGPSEALKEIKKEMSVYKSTGRRPVSLDRIYKALMTLPATSVESERAFSASGMFVTKMRTSLDDNSVNMFVFFEKLLVTQEKSDFFN